jgi:hypothetical protein
VGTTLEDLRRLARALLEREWTLSSDNCLDRGHPSTLRRTKFVRNILERGDVS